MKRTWTDKAESKNYDNDYPITEIDKSLDPVDINLCKMSTENITRRCATVERLRTTFMTRAIYTPNVETEYSSEASEIDKEDFNTHEDDKQENKVVVLSSKSITNDLQNESQIKDTTENYKDPNLEHVAHKNWVPRCFRCQKRHFGKNCYNGDHYYCSDYIKCSICHKCSEDTHTNNDNDTGSNHAEEEAEIEVCIVCKKSIDAKVKLKCQLYNEYIIGCTVCYREYRIM